MISQGLIQSVRIVIAGSYLAADAALAATSLVLESVLDFSTDGGLLNLNGVEYEYTAADYDTDTLTLATGLTAAALTADRVDVSPLTVEKFAMVTTDEGDAVTARIPHALVDRVPEGVREPGEEESVQYTLDNGEFVITDIVGRASVVTGALVRTAAAPNPRIELGDDPATSDADATSVRFYTGSAIEANRANISGVESLGQLSLLLAGFDSTSGAGPRITLVTDTDPVEEAVEIQATDRLSIFSDAVDINGAAVRTTATTRMATGNHLFTPYGTANALVSQAIVFPVGTFTAAPIVVATARTSGNATVHVAVASETATGFTLYFRRADAIPTNVGWIAIQLA